jgi:hypothetical protein
MSQEKKKKDKMLEIQRNIKICSFVLELRVGFNKFTNSYYIPSSDISCFYQGLEPVLELLKPVDFVGFHEPVLEGILNLKKRLYRAGSWKP